jgi:hypothetical protein
MSVGFEIVCDTCKIKMHAGILNSSASVFGYSSTDEDGRRKVAEFAFEHAYHDLEGGVRIVISDTTEKKRSDRYRDLSDPSEIPDVPEMTTADMLDELMSSHTKPLSEIPACGCDPPNAYCVEHYPKAQIVPLGRMPAIVLTKEQHEAILGVMTKP